MQIYLVGGAVRDELLGLPIGERDWVVIGATPEEMGRRGFKPVGRHFPVFLHPDTKEEYALARTERKTGRGYHGFEFHVAPDVSIEEDLRRRDLTINAIARGDDGVLIDPYGGRRDLEDKILRHVSPAFAEDPVRVLRVARFATRFGPLGFRVAPETTAMMRKMVNNGEIEALVAERVWKEFETALTEPAPSRFFTCLRGIGALAAVPPAAAPGLAELLKSPSAMDAVCRALDDCARSCDPRRRVHTVFCALVLQAAAGGVDLETACRRLHAPATYLKLAKAASFCLRRIGETGCLSAQVLLDVFERTDALRDAGRLAVVLDAWRFCDFPAVAGGKAQGLARIRAAFDAVSGLDLKRVAETCDGDVGEAVRKARLEALSREQGG